MDAFARHCNDRPPALAMGRAKKAVSFRQSAISFFLTADRHAAGSLATSATVHI
jgi:hypothetical protein